MVERRVSRNGQLAVSLKLADRNALSTSVQFPLYTILFVNEGAGTFSADFGVYPIKGPVIAFATPLQTLRMKGRFGKISMLQFHGDYYCIECHKKEVACNGILFNNIYTEPTLPLQPEHAAFFMRIINELDNELATPLPSNAVVLTLIQLLLAKATSIKTAHQPTPVSARGRDEKMEIFRQLIDQHFTSLRRPAGYAKLLSISPGTLSKRSKLYFRKTPSALIRERVILEAKKNLHLSRKSVKEIAHALRFEDEHYFSRYFKKVTKVSPQAFRTQTGISIVADLSI